MPETLSQARSALVRDRVVAGCVAALIGGEELTYLRVAKLAGVPERTVYRYFPTRDRLMAAIVDWANRRIGFAGPRPASGADAQRLVRLMFPKFDEIAPVVRHLLIAPEGRTARLEDNRNRQGAALDLVSREAPGLAADTSRRLAAVIQILCTAATWQTLHDYWGMTGADAADTSALAIEMLLAAAKSRRPRSTPAPKPAPRAAVRPRRSTKTPKKTSKI